MNAFDLNSMLVLGLLGSGHCIGMCGPLIVAFPGRCGGWSAHLFYHVGRLTTYTLVGCALGALGAGLESLTAESPRLLWLVSGQVGFSLVAAISLLWLGLTRLRILAEPAWLSSANPTRAPGIATVFAAARNRGGGGAMFLLGIMLGLLPCGLSYAAFARALPVGGALEGALMLLAFGIGTVPALLLIGTAASKLTHRFRSYSEILSGLLMIGMALSLLADAARVVLS